MKAIFLILLLATSALGATLNVSGTARVGTVAKGAVVASSWAPTNIAGCIAWYDVTNNTGNPEGSTLEWADQSGNGYNGTNGTAGSRPYLTNNYIGSMSAMYAPGGRVLYLPSTAVGCLRNVSGATFVGVVKFDTGSDYGHAFFASVNAATTTARFSAGEITSATTQGGRARRLDADVGINATAKYAVGDPHILSVVCDYVAGTIKVYTNGVAGVAGTLASSGGNSSDTDSAKVAIFANGGNSENLKGAVGGMAIYNTALSDGNRLLVEQWYTNRFGLSY